MIGRDRYTAVAIVLHWAIAVALLGLILLGWWMGDALEDRDTQAQAIAAFQLHKSLGLTVLILSLARLAWRVLNPPPPLPEAMKPWERQIAKATHIAFYALIIGLPLTGWLYVSTAWSVHDERPLEVPTVFFGLFEVPHLFGLSDLPDGVRAATAGILEFTHSKLAWVVIVLTALHIGAALKHQFIDKDNLLARMVPGLSGARAEPGRMAALGAGFFAIAVAATASIWAFAQQPASAPAPPVVASEQAITPAEEAATVESTEPADVEAPAPASGAPASWRVNQGASSIIFTGSHAGVPFEGRFSRWRADIRFDPGALDRSYAIVTIETASASDGVPVHDNALPGREWFDVANHPTATFRTTSIRARGDGAYEARGTLTIKGREIDTRLPFTLRIVGDRAIMEGTASVEREEADLGQSSDPDGEYVSREIGIRVRVEATRVP